MVITGLKALSSLCIHSCSVYHAIGESINCHANPVPAGSRLFDKAAAADFTKKSYIAFCALLTSMVSNLVRLILPICLT